MSAQQLITEHIDLWTSTIKAKNTQGRGSSKKRELYGIKKLRVLILELAVRGKLVPQDPNDEPASVLLERIAAEKAQLIKDKKIKRPKALPEITDEEKLFNLPYGWEWTRLGDTVAIIRGITFPGSEKYRDPAPERVACLRTTNVQHVTEWDDLLYVDNKFVKRADQYILKNDILMSMANSRELVGKVSFIADVVVKPCSFGGFLSVLRPYFVDPFYIMSVLRSPNVKAEMIGTASQTTNIANVSLEKLNPLVVAIPPLAEQHRIVAKVDELMALCDQLEQQTESSLDGHNQLVDTLLSTLTDARDAKELSDNWARLADHFDTLITTDYAVEQLKQTILQLAVMGKLVPQDPNDEPASELLKRITAEKSQLIKDKKIKKQKPLPEITEEEKPFNLPSGWEAARFGNLTSRLGSGSTPRGGKSAYVDSGIPFLRSQNVWNDGLKLDDVEYISNEVHLKMDNTKVVPGDVLLNITGASLGRTTIFPKELEEANVSQHVTIIRLIDGLMARFVHLAILSPLVQRLVWGRQVGMAIEGLSKKVLEQFEFPVPPLNEQHRIVVKADELMALCDQLKARIYDAQIIQINMADALVSNVTGSEIKDIEKMKAPDNELVTNLKLKVSPNDKDQAPLSAILTKHKGELTAKKLWQLSKLDIDVFYQQLKTEMEPGWIVEPEKAQMKEKR